MILRRTLMVTFLMLIITLLSTPTNAEYAFPSKPTQCWHHNCWTYANGQVMCDWEVEVCDGRIGEFRVI